jgi:predicted cation transporter
MWMVILGLSVILLLVLTLPFMIYQVEENLEIFLFIMGLAASAVSGILNKELIIKAFEELVMIAAAVLIAGLLFQYFNRQIKNGINNVLQILPLKVFVFLITVILGLVSSVITAIIAALLLVEIINALDIERQDKINLNIAACFAIGLGAALTPIGEPLSTIAVSKMNGDFWYLFRLIGVYVVPGILAFGAIAVYLTRKASAGPALENSVSSENSDQTVSEPVSEPDSESISEAIPELIPAAPKNEETYLEVVIRAGKVYLFVMALVLLGDGFRPFIDRYILGLSDGMLYWINMISAVLDNATMAAAELSPQMRPEQVQAILMGLLISGGMLIPGNIPNIITAGKLKINSREWAKLGVPLGLLVMVIYFAILIIL